MREDREPYGFSYKTGLFISHLMLFVGIAILVWMSVTFTGELTPAQDNLRSGADWMFKASVGAILAIVGGKAMS